MARRKLDQYFTPTHAVEELIKRLPLAPGDRVLEPCSGEGAIAVALIAHGCLVRTNDIDPQQPADEHFDAAQSRFWEGIKWDCPDWIITNPPFSHAAQIIPFAYEHARTGIAMLLRYSYLEPCEDRGEWLALNPPTGLISVPRISFTGDGKTDSVGTAWFVWDKDNRNHDAIQVVPRAR